ncbi:hypothetical protein SH601_05545 [Gracilibacillus sp. S3-1-1]|uniref:Uncharacterized protein n=1 Tax=Gracilibacillus pellucidus TaxID=3095368 RepID=A0ACC6M3A9_9BACI|nr:hypothetical protein [Gracilibacillus sp. S3-1-1]MDX8045449.1 hypothetical protein [Gracilibacillus sp. S3-1-1]
MAMSLLELQEKAEVSAKILMVASMLASDHLYSKNDAARDLVLFLKEYKYIQDLPVREVEEIEAGLKNK